MNNAVFTGLDDDGNFLTILRIVVDDDDQFVETPRVYLKRGKDIENHESAWASHLLWHGSMNGLNKGLVRGIPKADGEGVAALHVSISNGHTQFGKQEGELSHLEVRSIDTDQAELIADLMSYVVADNGVFKGRFLSLHLFCLLLFTGDAPSHLSGKGF
jgi:hypothetical protein